MIGKVTGRLDYRAEDHALIDVNGVGYVVYCAQPTLAKMPPPGGMVALYTDLLVREDNLQLFGFQTLAEKEWHRLLTSVQGVGAKAALSIAGTLGTDGVSRAISLGDAAAIRAAPGVGPKLAQRIIVELRDKAPDIIAMGAAGTRAARVDEAALIEPINPEVASPVQAPVADHSAAARADALSALVNLGYGHGEAAGAIAEVMGDAPGADTQELITLCLRHLAPKG
ncbi:MAG: Holliday junction branch migration protein RuvA [Paracoccaceae bacterium]